MSSALCQQVGHWRVSKEVIGNGTTSTVRLASHATIPTLCAAVKIISRTGLLIKAEGDPGALHLADAVIDREVLLTKIASHERIVKLYNFVADGDLAYMILEHAPNKTLFDLFHSHSSFLSPVFITHLFSQLMQAVDHIHSLHIVHRDIKLENLFLFGPDIKDIILQADSTHGRNRKRKDILPHNLKHASAHATKPSPHPYTALTVKLGDFGLSHTHPPTALSKVFHGSPHYQAPELWARAPHRPFPTDVWSAGVVLYALVGRRLPFGLDELEEWGRVFCKSDDSDGFYVDNTHQDKRGFEMDEKDHANRPPIPRPGVPSHVPFVVPEVMPPAIDHLLQRMFRINPTMRPTSREILADAWCGLTGCVSPSQNVPVLRGDIRRANEHPILSQPPSMPPPQHIADAYGPQDIYNIATLCTPPSTHVARATFCGSSLERMVRGRLGGDQCIEKVWASKLAAWVAWEGEGWVGASEQGKMVLEKGNVKGNMKEKEKEKRVGWLERKGWSQSLGRIKGADVRAHLAASFGHVAHAGQREHAEQVAQAVPAAQRGGGEHEKTVDPVVLHPNLRASSSSLRIKAEHKLPEIKRNVEYRPSPLSSTVVSRVNAAAPTRELSPTPLEPKHSSRTLRVETSDPGHARPTVHFPSPLPQPPGRSALQPKHSSHTLRVETSDPGHAHPTLHDPSPLLQPPGRSALQSPLAQTFTPRHNAVATIRSRPDLASTLRSRHDALLRRAYELGFGPQDLKAFAEEAGRIVRDAREGSTENSAFAATGSERGSDAITPTEGSSSMATTLVPEHGEVGQKSDMSLVSAPAPALKAVDVGGGSGRRGVDVDMAVDVTFDVDFQTDLRWI